MMPTELLFDPKILGTEIQDKLPKNLVVRPMSAADFSLGFYDCLKELTVIGDVTEQMFLDRFEMIKRTNSKHVIVIFDTDTSRIVATGALFVEPKFSRDCGLLGHIEDVSVHPSHRGKKLGVLIIDQLKKMCEALNCYKISLNCNLGNVAFYEKCGFSKKEQQMVVYV
ncbi:Glucosamine 6-phosphate N-acetyltransferase 1 [Smittium culicis]|uniref:Glucosamine 6-phosphate N-acetyltransferase n=1 Tax=Smittium culicis TaxID=133412 RepID=A0A1R1WZ46_9FUNG|nr:Glucosamine 6-phosphate N-acetyltransferase 1 [Smittium culicis]OMJ27165.1 Glucosamine 6-phosphate N-acetyltransferase 1 [Smittium culicis]